MYARDIILYARGFAFEWWLCSRCVNLYARGVYCMCTVVECVRADSPRKRLVSTGIRLCRLILYPDLSLYAREDNSYEHKTHLVCARASSTCIYVCVLHDVKIKKIKKWQMDALDKFVFGEACHPAFDIALRIENYTGVKTNKLARGSSSTAVVSARVLGGCDHVEFFLGNTNRCISCPDHAGGGRCHRAVDR